MPSYTFTHSDGTRVVVELGGQVLSAEIDPRMGWRELHAARKRKVAPFAADESSASPPSTLYPSVTAAGIDRFTPLLALVAKAKRFDDRLNAAVEMLSHHGVAQFDGIYALFAQIRGRLSVGPAYGLLDAAAHLVEGKSSAELGPEKIHTRRWLGEFLGNPERSTPLGIYTDTEELTRIFRHDRLLQSELEGEPAIAIRSVLEADPKLLAAYERHLAIMTKVTGPLAVAPVTRANRDGKFAVLPASDAAENRLVKALFGDAPVPDGFVLGSELVTRIHDGRLDTVPRASDGWYAHQFHAIAALLSPNTGGLQIGARYRKELEETFQALFALNRETHVKQVEHPRAGSAARIFIRPMLSVEPLPEFYARTASAYRFLREQLVDLFGDEVLRSAPLVDFGLDILAGLIEIETLFRGAEAVSRFELGQSEDSPETTMSRAAFGAWQLRSGADPDLQYDLRVAVPFWFDRIRKTYRIGATIGLEMRTLAVDFVTRPTVTTFGSLANAPIYTSTKHDILVPITLECNVRKPPTRAELRAICDREKTPAAIKYALQSA